MRCFGKQFASQRAFSKRTRNGSRSSSAILGPPCRLTRTSVPEPHNRPEAVNPPKGLQSDRVFRPGGSRSLSLPPRGSVSRRGRPFPKATARTWSGHRHLPPAARRGQTKTPHGHKARNGDLRCYCPRIHAPVLVPALPARFGPDNCIYTIARLFLSFFSLTVTVLRDRGRPALPYSPRHPERSEGSRLLKTIMEEISRLRLEMTNG